MPLTEKGQHILNAMEETYGSEKKAKSVLYASKNAGKIKGIDNMRARDQGAPVTGQMPNMPQTPPQTPVTGDEDEGPKGVLKPIGNIPEEGSIKTTKAGGPSGTPDAEMVMPGCLPAERSIKTTKAGSPDKVGHRHLAKDRPPDKQVGTLKDYAAVAGAKR